MSAIMVLPANLILSTYFMPFKRLIEAPRFFKTTLDPVKGHVKLAGVRIVHAVLLHEVVLVVHAVLHGAILRAYSKALSSTYQNDIIDTYSLLKHANNMT